MAPRESNLRRSERRRRMREVEEGEEEETEPPSSNQRTGHHLSLPPLSTLTHGGRIEDSLSRSPRRDVAAREEYRFPALTQRQRQRSISPPLPSLSPTRQYPFQSYYQPSYPIPGQPGPSTYNYRQRHTVYPSRDDIPADRRGTVIHPAPPPPPSALPPPSSPRVQQRSWGPTASSHPAVQQISPTHAQNPFQSYQNQPSPRRDHFGSSAEASSSRQTRAERSRSRTSGENSPSKAAVASHSGRSISSTVAHGEPYPIHRNPWRTSTTVPPDDWAYDLQVVQGPVRGKALRRDPWKKATSTLSPPTILRLIVRDRLGREVLYDNPVLTRHMAQMVVTAELMAPDGISERSRLKFISENKSGSNSQQAIPLGGTTQSLLGTTAQMAQTFEMLFPQGKKAYFFVFPDLVVRPVGRFTLKFRLSTVANPVDNTTSFGVTRVLTSVLTLPFSISDGWDGPVPMTEWTRNLILQRAHGLGRLGGSRLGTDEEMREEDQEEEYDEYEEVEMPLDELQGEEAEEEEEDEEYQ